MKYSKSAFPYLALLFLVLIGLPFINAQAKKTQQLVVKIEVKQQDFKNQSIVGSQKETSEQDFLVMTSK